MYLRLSKHAIFLQSSVCVLLLLVFYPRRDGELHGERTLRLQHVALGDHLIGRLPDVVVQYQSRLVGRGLRELERSSDSRL